MQHALHLYTSSLLILSLYTQTSATDESQNTRHYLPVASIGASNDRLQQIMKGAAGAGEISRPKRIIKSDATNIKIEIDKLNTTYVYQSNWPSSNIKLGAVTAVSFDKDGHVVIFHRVDRIWSQTTFNITNNYQETYKGPIKENTVLAFERNTGVLAYEWGKLMFYMPHGLTIDFEDNVWLTDVALHQVFKFPPRGAGNKPLLTLGIPFSPGAGRQKFCKPTSVAVLENGDFFVADGYCNARILKYSKTGELILTWGQNTFAGESFDVAPEYYFAIPHALTLVPEKELICAADRENGRIQCFYHLNGTFHSQYHNALIGDRLFSMAYTPAGGGEFIIVNGPTAELGFDSKHYNEVHGYVMNINSKAVISKFGPNDLQFENPHDVAVTIDGNEIYVAELNPMRIHKFLHRSLAKPMSLSAAKPTATTTITATSNEDNDKAAVSKTIAESKTKTSRHPSGTAILIVVLMLIFAITTFTLSVLVARRRKRAGCMPFGTQNRRHAWDKTEGFKLGGLLLDRNAHDGFEKLQQNASDDEQESSTTMLTSAQFA